MKVRETDVSQSDKRSARLFFAALADFYDMSEWSVLDAFARNGQLTLPMYIKNVQGHKGGYVEAWELGPEHREALDTLGPDAIHIGCSYEAVKLRDISSKKKPGKFDMVVIDTPQGLHKDYASTVHVEHFDFLRLTLDRLLKPQGVVVVYVNKAPYNKDEVGSQGYDEYEEYDFALWMKARREFYRTDPQMLTEWEAIKAYEKVVNRHGFDLRNVFSTPCFSDVPGKDPYAFRLALEVSKL